MPHTLNVVGNVNELGISIVETTFGGRGDLDGQGTGAIMSYGDLIWTTLSRATSARDAIRIMDELTQSYGYESSGESFGVGDSDEVWLMEMVSKGKYGKGSVWVASRIPDGYVGSTANQARTEKFDHNDPENVLFAADVVTFAKQIGAYPPGGSDEDFPSARRTTPSPLAARALASSACGPCSTPSAAAAWTGTWTLRRATT